MRQPKAWDHAHGPEDPVCKKSAQLVRDPQYKWERGGVLFGGDVWALHVKVGRVGGAIPGGPMDDDGDTHVMILPAVDSPVGVGGGHLYGQRLGEAIRDGGNGVPVHLEAVEGDVTVVEVLAKRCVADAGRSERETSDVDSGPLGPALQGAQHGQSGTKTVAADLDFSRRAPHQIKNGRE